MRDIVIVIILLLSLNQGISQIIADTTYNPLIKKESSLRTTLIGQSIHDYVEDAALTASLSHGKKIHINLWSTTCRPCIQEFPELNELKESFENRGIHFIAIAKEKQQATEKILYTHELDFEKHYNGLSLFERLGVRQYPVNLFIDEEGIIQEVSMGIFMKGEIVEGRTIMNMNNLPYYKMILAQWTN